jgi:hypothetical protein
MAFRVDIDLEGATGGYGAFFRDTPIFFSEIFAGIPQYPLGSTVRIEEILRIYTSIDDPLVVDVDTRYYQNKYFLGNWMIIDELGIPLHAQENDGFLSWTIQEIKRYSEYTIVHHPSVQKAESSTFIVEQCNFFLKPSVYLPQPISTPISGFDPISKSPLFRGKVEISPPPLINTKFNQKIHGIGLHFFPGTSGNRLEYTIAAINNIAVDLPATRDITCGLDTENCEASFARFLAAAPSERFETEAQCVATLSGTSSAFVCGRSSYECPTDPTQTYEYWAKGFAPP